MQTSRSAMRIARSVASSTSRCAASSTSVGARASGGGASCSSTSAVGGGGGARGGGGEAMSAANCSNAACLSAVAGCESSSRSYGKRALSASRWSAGSFLSSQEVEPSSRAATRLQAAARALKKTNSALQTLKCATARPIPLCQ